MRRTTKKTTKKNTKKIKKTKKKNSTNFAALYGNGCPFKFKIKGKTYTGFYDAAESQKSVKLLNEFRVENGKKPLKQTKALVKASMVRGKEISVVYSHRRPNDDILFGDGEVLPGGRETEHLILIESNSEIKVIPLRVLYDHRCLSQIIQNIRDFSKQCFIGSEDLLRIE